MNHKKQGCLTRITFPIKILVLLFDLVALWQIPGRHLISISSFYKGLFYNILSYIFDAMLEGLYLRGKIGEVLRWD
jgi:hypothetical protein